MKVIIHFFHFLNGHLNFPLHLSLQNRYIWEKCANLKIVCNRFKIIVIIIIMSNSCPNGSKHLRTLNMSGLRYNHRVPFTSLHSVLCCWMTSERLKKVSRRISDRVWHLDKWDSTGLLFLNFLRIKRSLLDFYIKQNNSVFSLLLC